MLKSSHRETLKVDEQNILALMVLIPPPISLDTLIHITSLCAVDLLKILENLKKREIICQYESLGDGYYCFKNFQKFDLIFQELSTEKKQVLAKKLIGFFEANLDEGLKKSLTITNLYASSSLKPKSFERILESADYCSYNDFKEAAALYYQIIIDSFPKNCKSKQKKEIFIKAALGLLKIRGYLIPLARQKYHLKKSLHFAEELKKEKMQARINLSYAQVLKTMGEYKLAATHFDNGWEIAQNIKDEYLLKEAALLTAEFLFWQGHVKKAVERYEQVIGNLEELPTDETTLRASAVLGWCYGICGQIARGIGLIEAVRIRANEQNLKEVKIYADLMSVLTLLEARRISEAKTYLDQILTIPQETLGRYILWAANAAMGFVHFHYGSLQKCYKYQCLAHENSKKLGWPHHRGPWNFEYMEVLEEAGFIHPEMNYESELKRFFCWPDIYMQGVAYRYRAKRDLKNGIEKKIIYDNLHQSIKYLKKSGAKIELARTQILFARLLLEEKDRDQAQKILKEAWNVLSHVNSDLFPSDLKQFIEEESNEKFLIKTIVEVGNTLGTVRDEKRLLKRFIDLIMRLTGAEQGVFFLLEENSQLRLVASRNLDPDMINSNEFKKNYDIILHVSQTGEKYIEPDPSPKITPDHGLERTGFIVCSPVILQGRILGVFFLSSHLSNMYSVNKNLPLLEAIGNQVATALDNVRSYEEIAALKDQLKDETRFYRNHMELSAQPENIIGQSETIQFVKSQIQQVAQTDSSVLISGETGVGKELVARTIHNLSMRHEGPFIPVNIATFSESLIESELFGHERGAFTGASKSKLGRFELAHKGTLFLDDIENLTHEIQIKLLRILQEREFERVGGTSTLQTDFRLIATTNQDLESMVKKGMFRSDLYYRLNVFPIHIPPLRERGEDIRLLASHFLDIYASKMKKQINGISKHNMQRLLDYSWPGNVRELQHVIERAVILTNEENLKIPDLEQNISERTVNEDYITLEEMQRNYIIEVLQNCNWKVSGKDGAAQILGLKPSTLYSKIKRLNIKKEIQYSI